MKRDYSEKPPPTAPVPLSTVHGPLALNDENITFVLYDDEPTDIVEATSRYKITSELGRGGMGTVYRARDLDLNRDVALKILFSKFLDRPKITEQFISESRIMSSLQHPGIVHIYECGQTSDGRPFHSMKLVEGITMSSMIHESKFDQQQRVKLLNIFSIVCQAMAYTHSQNVIHLDLKPDNVMVGAFGEVHVMDWGLARTLDSADGPIACPSPDLSKNHENSANSDRVHGTLHYMAPEQARAEPVSRATDVFCLGAILCEILTGQRLYAETNPIAIWKKAKKGNLESEFDRLDNCTADSTLVRLAKRCLQVDPADRPIDASEIAFEMASYRESALEQVECDMTRFFELSLDLFCIAGFDGFFRRINSNFSRVLGFSDHELLSRPFLDFVQKEDRFKTIEVMGELLEGQPVVRFCNRYRTASGEAIMFEWTAKSIPEENVIFAVARQID